LSENEQKVAFYQIHIRHADSTEIPISDVQLCDILLVFTDFGQIITTITEEISIHEVEEYIEVCFGQNILHVTREHPFFIGNRIFCLLGQLSINDCIYSFVNDNFQLISTTNTKVLIASTTVSIIYALHNHRLIFLMKLLCIINLTDDLSIWTILMVSND
jgi:predicted membrane chloride channel (bestrophin family)